MLHCIQAGHALDLDGPVLSGGYRRFCTAKPPPRSPYATASLRRSGSTDSTPLRPTSDGTNPADLLALAGPTALSEALAAARPLAEQLIDERLKTCHPLTLCW